MKPQTLEELIEDTSPLYELPEGMVRVFGVDREGIKYVAMAVDKEAFLKKVYEAGKRQGAKEFIDEFFPLEDEGEVLETIDDSHPGDGFFIWVDSIKRELNKFTKQNDKTTG